MSELNNKYLDFSGLQKYDERIKAYIGAADQKLSDELKELIIALDEKIGNLEIEGSDDKNLSEVVADIYSSINGIIDAQDKLSDKDGELEEEDKRLAELIAGVRADLEWVTGSNSDNEATLGDINIKLNELEELINKNIEDIKEIASVAETAGGTAEEAKSIAQTAQAEAQAATATAGEAKSIAQTAQASAETAAGQAQASAEAAQAAQTESHTAAGQAQASAEAAQAAQASAEIAAGQAQASAEAAQAAEVTANSASEVAGEAKSIAQTAQAEAQSATATAGEANAAAGQASEVAGEAKSIAQTAQAEAQAATATAGEASEVAGEAKTIANENKGLIEGLTKKLNGLDVKYDIDTKYIRLYDENNNEIGSGFDASAFITDGMIKDVDFVDGDGSDSDESKTTLRFTFNTDAGDRVIDVDFSDYVDTYHGDGTSIELNSSTNTFSVKNVEATKTTLTSSIEVNGGPLANDSTEANDKWPDDWYENGVKVIPSGKSMEEILTSLFLKVTNGSVKKGNINWEPSLSKPTVSITQSGTVEVGTKLTATANTTNTVSSNSRTCTFTCSPGHFLSTGTDDNGDLVFGSYVAGNKTVTANSVDPAYDGTPSIKTYWNNAEVTNVNGTTEYTVSIVGDNTFRVDQSGVTAYAGAFDDITVYGSTNTKVPVESVSASISDDVAPDAKPLTSTNSATVKGARAYWMGCMPSPLAEFTNASIREAGEDADSGLKKTLGSSPATTLEVPAGSYDVVIITQKQVTSVISKAQGNFEIGGNFTKNHQEVNVEGANGFTAIKYHVYHCNADWDKDTLTISYK